MQIYFNEKDQLYFDGYDTGKIVEEVWGDSCHEYIYTIEPEEVNKFYPVFNLKEGDRSGLLQAIKKNLVLMKPTHYLGNSCWLMTLNINILYGTK